MLTGCSGQEVVAHDLDEREANEILVFLSDRGIESVKVKAEASGTGGSEVVKWNISVPANRKREAMAVLSQAGLPRRQGQYLLGLFKESGLVPSELQQQVRYQAGLAEQIASTIRKMDGVVDAEVTLSIPKEDPLNPGTKKEKTTASVYVKHTGVLNDPNSHMISNIRNLVAGAVPGLSYDDVTVVPDLARYRGAEGSGAAGGEGEDLRTGNVPLVSVWTLVLAKDSLATFRMIFFAFVVAIVLLVFCVLAILWKVSPLLGAAWTQGALFKKGRIEPTDLMPPPPPVEEKASKGKKKKKVDDDEEDEDPFDEDEES